MLGLPSSASEAEVKEARNFVTKAFHPDKYQPGSKDQQKAHQRQIEINEAYEKLMHWFSSRKLTASAASVTNQERIGPGGSGAAKTNRRDATILGLKILLTLIISWCWISSINDMFAKAVPNPHADWPILVLSLCTLALIWFLFAPESHALTSRWTMGADRSDDKAEQGRS